MGKHELWLSPMEGVSDIGFRKICSAKGANQTFTEMIRADAFVRNNKATLELMDTYSPETGVQFLVSKPKVLKKALEIITKKRAEKDQRYLNITKIDLNFGCPSKEVISIGAGPALLKRTNRMRELLTTLKEYSPVPCGIKIRLGMNQRERDNKIYLKVLEIANETCDWITVHPKTADQGSLEPIDKNALKEIIKKAKIPVIGSGFVMDGKSAEELFDLGCSAVMIARAAIMNPWVFEEIKHYFKTGKEIKIQKDYDKMLEQYLATAKRFNSKRKYVYFHKMNFGLKIKGDYSYHSPSRIMHWT